MITLLSLMAFVAEAQNPRTAESPADEPSANVILVVGLPGNEEFDREFAESARYWHDAAETANFNLTTIGLERDAEHSDKELFSQALAAQRQEQYRQLWIVLIGHGTFDGRAAKFNLRGPDFSADDMESWLAGFTRPIALIDCSSSSGPFLNKLSSENRIVVCATRSGFELNVTRFGKYFSQSITDPEADLDKDGQTSLLEAFLSGARLTSEFYESDGRLVTEHSLLDDNGDGKGTQPDWFRGVRPIKKASGAAVLDGFRAHQFHLVPSPFEQQLSPEMRRRRDALELEVINLRERKPEFDEDEYFKQLESKMIELAELYESIEKQGQPPENISDNTATDSAASGNSSDSNDEPAVAN